jgi:hypothetical protein
VAPQLQPAHLCGTEHTLTPEVEDSQPLLGHSLPPSRRPGSMAPVLAHLWPDAARSTSAGTISALPPLALDGWHPCRLAGRSHVGIDICIRRRHCQPSREAVARCIAHDHLERRGAMHRALFPVDRRPKDRGTLIASPNYLYRRTAEVSAPKSGASHPITHTGEAPPNLGVAAHRHHGEAC